MTPMTVLDLLTRAYKMIVDPSNWSKDGAVSDHKLCAVQALETAAESMPDRNSIMREAERILNSISRDEFPGSRSIVGVNDDHGHWAVCRVYRRAIKELSW